MGKRFKRRKEQKQKEAKPAGSSSGCFGWKTISQEQFEELLHNEDMQEKYKKAYDVVNDDRENLLEQLREKAREIQEKNEMIESQKRDIRYAELTRAQARQDRDDLKASLKLVQATNSDLQALVDKLQKSESTIKIQLEVEINNAENLELSIKDITEKLHVASDESHAAQLKFTETQTFLEDLQAKCDLTNLQNKSRIQDLMQQTRDMRVEIDDLEKELKKWNSDSVIASVTKPLVTTSLSDSTSSINKQDAFSTVFRKRETIEVYMPNNIAPGGRKSRSLTDLEREARESQLVALESTNNLLRFRLHETTSELEHLRAMYTG